MAEYDSLGHDITCVDAQYQHPGIASIYLLRDADEVAIIETGTSYSLANVMATLDELGIAEAQVKYVIPTHVHLDHAGGAGAMMQQFANATLLVHPRGARHLIDPARLIAGTIAVYGEEKFQRLYGNIKAIDAARVTVAEDLARFSVGRRELLFIDSPGHARHHFCIYDEHSNGLFTGDTLGISYGPMKSLARGLIPTTPPSQFDPEALLASLDRLLGYAPERLYLTHYGEFQHPLRQQASFARWIDQYVQLCTRLDPVDAEAELELERALASMILEGLDNGGEDLAPLLGMDVRLNAQGLAHWWRGRQDG